MRNIIFNSQVQHIVFLSKYNNPPLHELPKNMHIIF